MKRSIATLLVVSQFSLLIPNAFAGEPVDFSACQRKLAKKEKRADLGVLGLTTAGFAVVSAGTMGAIGIAADIYDRGGGLNKPLNENGHRLGIGWVSLGAAIVSFAGLGYLAVRFAGPWVDRVADDDIIYNGATNAALLRRLYLGFNAVSGDQVLADLRKAQDVQFQTEIQSAFKAENQVRASSGLPPISLEDFKSRFPAPTPLEFEARGNDGKTVVDALAELKGIQLVSKAEYDAFYAKAAEFLSGGESRLCPKVKSILSFKAISEAL